MDLDRNQKLPERLDASTHPTPGQNPYGAWAAPMASMASGLSEISPGNFGQDRRHSETGALFAAYSITGNSITDY